MFDDDGFQALVEGAVDDGLNLVRLDGRNMGGLQRKRTLVEERKTRGKDFRRQNNWEGHFRRWNRKGGCFQGQNKRREFFPGRYKRGGCLQGRNERGGCFVNETRVVGYFQGRNKMGGCFRDEKSGNNVFKDENWRRDFQGLSMRGIIPGSKIRGDDVFRCYWRSTVFIRRENKIAGSNQESSCHNIHKSKIFILKYRIFANANITVQVLSWLAETCGVTMLIFQPKELDYYIKEGPY